MAAKTSYYDDYTPSKAAAIAGSIVFCILTILQIWRIHKSRKWFGYANVVGGLFETVGLAARAYSADHLTEKNPYIVQVLLILLAPILFAAAVYMFLGRLIKASGYPQLSLIRITWVTKIFVGGDIFCFLIQAAGAAKLVNATSKDSISTAQDIILGGLGLQVLFFCFFIVCAVVFHTRIYSRHVARSIDPGLNLNRMLTTLYLCSMLITVRNAYRLVEYKTGSNSYLQTHEWPAYGLDLILMAVFMAISLTWYSINTPFGDPKQYPLADRGESLSA